ncbi:helix-turn-helix transcriptional regulator [Acinetobacter baumannii]|nr:helix-turn-helix transcriptional regulator [Acinetobacter baumannii]MCF4205414.1 helix-turn-helix transcriptional regulator [Acinetobacter baumannii]MCF4220128.1 helix-turn-helix transcriptional regulator [Acinetobacter baumannii]HCQ9698576.1 helix-turn-helix transcriptional regulator [Acinetobacter baumannii]HCQ9707397.1 helix-turn-helix transcriptional regulator [Acinetobacter baumannii]
MELKDRLKLARKNAHMTQKDLSIKAGVSQATISQLESGLMNSSTHLPAIAKALDVDAFWLQTGKEDSKQENLSRLLIPVDTWDEETPLNLDEVEIAFYKNLRLACGNGTIAEVREQDKSVLRVPRQLVDKLGVYRDKAFSALAEDDSMKPTINDGDIVFVDENRNYIKDGKVFAIEHGGLFRCKRLYNLPDGGVRIVSDNKEEYGEERLTKEQIIAQGFRVIGWIWKIDRIEVW